MATVHSGSKAVTWVPGNSVEFAVTGCNTNSLAKRTYVLTNLLTHCLNASLI